MGVGREPVFGWTLESAQRGQYQSAYRICVSKDSLPAGKEKYIWDSGKVHSGISQNVKAQIPSIKPGRKYYWKVRVWDRNGRPTAWSRTARLLTALDKENGWGEARWIALEELPDEDRVVPGVPRYGGEKQAQG